MDIQKLSVKEALKGMEDGEFTSFDLVKECLSNINKKDNEIKAFLEVWEEDALEKAKAVDKKRKDGEPVGDLAGVPIAIKDNILWQGHTSTGASRILEPYIASYSATVVDKLLAADAVLIGRTNCDEFACGGSTEHSGYYPTHNPHDTTRVPGGSSGGSTAAVASGMCVAALGSDTGGSIRQPASLSGVVGMKPTYGRVSRYGLMAMASSLDQIGPITKTVDGAARVLHVIEGADSHDSTTENQPPTDVAGVLERLEEGRGGKDLKGIKLGVPKEYFALGLDGEVKKVVESAIDKLKNLGAEIIEISLPHTEFALATYYVLMPSEVSSNLARYDGIRYGLTRGTKLEERYVESRNAGLGTEVKRRILLGTFALSSGYYDAYYKKSVEVRGAITNDFHLAFKDVDLIVGPTSPVTAFKLGEKMDDPLVMYLADVYTVSANLAGIPAISVPCGKVDGLPVGLQFMAPHFMEAGLLRIASQVK